MEAAPDWRLLVHGGADGAWNMALDELLLEIRAARPGPPTLRLYGWDPPALSLGRSQHAGRSCDTAFLRDAGIDLVRRPTGGLAVLHQHERTYAVIGSLRREPFAGGVLRTYARVAAAVTAALRSLGADARAVSGGTPPGPAGPGRPPACFDAASAHEIAIEGCKVVGAAQLRRRGAFLLHGSILVRCDESRLAAALGRPVAGPIGSLERALGRVPGAAEIDRALIEGFARSFGVRLVRQELSGAEAARAARLRADKYQCAGWTLEGRSPG